MYCVYLLKCTDGDYYEGCTKDLRERFNGHINGWAPATASKQHLELVFYCAFTDNYKAFEFENYLKSGSGITFMRMRLI